MSHNVQTSLVVTGQQGLPPFRAVSNSGLDAFAVGADGYVYLYNVDVATVSPTYSFLVLGAGGKVEYTSMFSTGGPAPGTSLDVVDYITGETFSSVSTMIFRGGVVSVPPSGTASGVTVTGPAPVVTVWIPAPNYVGYFTPTNYSGPYTRYVSNPSINGYNSTPGNNGYYGTGTWDPATNFTASTTRNVLNSSGVFTLFSESEFACYNTGTTMSLYLYNHDGSILRSIVGHVIGGAGATSQGGLTLNITSFASDNDRYKSAANGTVNVGNEFPNGGRFNWKVVHNNGEGAGNVTYGVYEYTQNTPVFYDNDGSSSSSNISGVVDFDELTPTLVYYSGVAFYDTGSTFALTASDVNLLNDITFPTSKQIDFLCNNMAISGTLDGHSNGTKAAGTAITGWTIAWDKSGLTYSRTGTVNSSGVYVPGFGTNNTLSASYPSYISSTIYDYSSSTYNSGNKNMLFDTDPTDTIYYNNNPLDSENSRLLTGSVLSNGNAAFVSNVTLPSDELQYIFGRVIYPQENFTTYYPTINWTNSVNYSSSSGSNKTFPVYVSPLSGSGTTNNVSFNDYRWHVTSYGADANFQGPSFTTSFTNGYFQFSGNFQESDLHYSFTSNSAPGNNDLVILVGIDSSGSNSKPDKFLFVSGDPATYETRQTHPNNLDSSPKQIKWSKGTISATVYRIWLFVGYKNTTRGKNLYMTDISFYA